MPALNWRFSGRRLNPAGAPSSGAISRHTLGFVAARRNFSGRGGARALVSQRRNDASVSLEGLSPAALLFPAAVSSARDRPFGDNFCRTSAGWAGSMYVRVRSLVWNHDHATGKFSLFISTHIFHDGIASQRKIDSSNEGHNAQVWRLAAFNNRLDHPW